MLLENLTWEDARDLVKKDPVVIVPLGAIEQHGPHLPLKVDIASADYIARKVGEKTDALVVPPLNFGYSELWHTYPGTVSFSAETFRMALHDICYSLIRCGFKKILLLNGHNPNLILMQAAAYELVDKYENEGISIAAATYIFMADKKCDAIGENFKDGTHANEMETSIFMYLFSDKVKADKAKEVADNYKMRKCISFDGGACIVNRWPDSKTYCGAYGNPETATKEKGRLYLEALIEDISQFVYDFGAGNFDPIGKDGIPQDRI